MRWKVMRTLYAVVLVLVGGCGPIMLPAVPRLEPAQQAEVDRAWDNLLTPVYRADRGLLLDVLLADMMYSLGVDRVHYVAEKDTAAGVVRMVVDFDRRRAGVAKRQKEGEWNAFDGAGSTSTVEVRGRDGNLLRRESYSGEEVMDRAVGSRKLDPNDGLGQMRLQAIRAVTRPVE